MAEIDDELLNNGPRRGLELDGDEYTPGAVSIDDPTILILKRTPMADYNGLNCEVKLNGVPNSKVYTYSGTDEIVGNFENTFGNIIIGEYFTVIMYSSMFMIRCVDFDQENKTITFDITLDSESSVEDVPLKSYIERGPNIVQTNNESQYSTAEGVSTEANNAIERAEGSYNVSHKASDDYGDAGNTQYSIGVGTSSEDRKNAFMVMQNGDAYLYGVGGYDGTETKTENANIKTLQESIGSGGQTYTAGQNISIDASNVISANGYVFDETLFSFAEGESTQATGEGAHSEGGLTQATNQCAHAEGLQSVASGKNSHAEGNKSVASGKNSHAEGGTVTGQNPTTAAGSGSHAEGQSTLASGQASHAEGQLTEAKNGCEHAQGNCNLSHKNSDTYGDAGNTINSIGIGQTLDNVPQRKNAFEIMQNGDCYVIRIGGYQGTDTKTQDASIKPLQDVISVMLNVIDEMDYRISVLEGKIPYTELWYTTSDGNIVTPWNADSLPTIVSNTYNNGKGIIKFANNLTEVGTGAFYNCGTLTSVSFPTSVTTFGQNAFYNCDGLTSVTIPENTSSIGSLAFQCVNITSFIVRAKNLVNSYGLGMTTNGLAQITSLTFGIEVESIPGDMCNNMINLTNIIYEGTMSQWNNLTLAEGWNNDAPTTAVHCSDGDISLVESQPNDEIWYTSSNNTTINIDPESAEYYFDKPIVSNTYSDGKGIIKFNGDLTSIEDTFYNITENYDTLTSVQIPESVTNLAYGSGLFSGCSSLTTVKLPTNYEGGIGESFFSQCENLETIIIPEGVTFIGDSAFGGCLNLTTITIPSNVTTIGPAAFGNCESLTSIICEPTTPPIIDTGVFYSENDYPIYVPNESLTAYRTATIWSDYASRIQPIQ